MKKKIGKKSFDIQYALRVLPSDIQPIRQLEHHCPVLAAEVFSQVVPGLHDEEV